MSIYLDFICQIMQQPHINQNMLTALEEIA